MLEEVFILAIFFLAGIILFLVGHYTSTAMMTLLAAIIFFICAMLPAGIFLESEYIAIACIGILSILGLVSLIVTSYLWWVEHTAKWKNWG